MLVNIIALGTKMPSWTSEAFYEYQKRMPKEWQVKLIELPIPKRSKNLSIEKAQQLESKKILEAIPSSSIVIALDEHGVQYSTSKLSQKMGQWQQSGKNITFIIGGPDGFSKECLKVATETISLSTLTFPHMLVRVILIEQLYRAWTISSHHPYHRE